MIVTTLVPGYQEVRSDNQSMLLTIMEVGTKNMHQHSIWFITEVYIRRIMNILEQLVGEK